MNPVVRVSEAASMALHSLVLMAQQPDRSMSVREIVTRLPVSSAHLAKVLQRLARIGLLDSVRGPKGGFRLSRRPDQVTLLEVYEAVDGPLRPGGCMFDHPACPAGQCIFGGVLVSAAREVRERLAGTRLSDLPALPTETLGVANGHTV
jgi:Rrf2 family protein